MQDKGRHLDLSSGEDLAARSAEPQAAGASTGGKILGVHFECCDIYRRIYPNREGTAYVGHCPRCARRVQFLIGAEGTSARFFRAQ